MYLDQQRSQKLKKQEELTRSATLCLISSQYNETENLVKKFQDTKGLFDSEKRKDYRFEKAKENYKKKMNAQNVVNNTSSGKKGVLLKEQRIEIIDYYEMNQKLIDSKIQTKTTKEDNLQFFKDVKKLNTMLVEKARMKKQEEREKELSVLRTSKSAIGVGGINFGLNDYNRISTPTKSPNRIPQDYNETMNRSASKIEIKQRLDFSKSRSPLRK